MPDDIRIIAIEAENTLDFVEGCSPDVVAAVPQAVSGAGPSWPPGVAHGRDAHQEG